MDNVIVERFNSISQFLTAIESRENNYGMKGNNHAHDGSEDFTGTKSWSEACDQLKNGWDKYLDEIKGEVGNAKVKTNVSASRQRVTTGVVGYAPLVPNAIRGLPNSMITAERIPQKVKAISIVYNFTVNSEWKANEIAKCGIAVLKIVNELELRGYRVQLNIEPFAARTDKSHCRAVVSVKDWRQPMDLKKLCFPIASPSMFRRIGFRWIETVPNMTDRGFSGGYGIPITGIGEYEKAVRIAKEEKVISENDYYLTAHLIKSCKFDAKKVMEEAGISCLK